MSEACIAAALEIAVLSHPVKISLARHPTHFEVIGKTRVLYLMAVVFLKGESNNCVCCPLMFISAVNAGTVSKWFEVGGLLFWGFFGHSESLAGVHSAFVSVDRRCI